MDKTATKKQPLRLNEVNFTPILIAIAVIIATLGNKRNATA